MFSTIPHEFTDGVCLCDQNASFGGGDNIALSDSREKTPDFVIYNTCHAPNKQAHLPTIIWEVGYSESVKKLG